MYLSRDNSCRFLSLALLASRFSAIFLSIWLDSASISVAHLESSPAVSGFIDVCSPTVLIRIARFTSNMPQFGIDQSGRDLSVSDFRRHMPSHPLSIVLRLAPHEVVFSSDRKYSHPSIYCT